MSTGCRCPTTQPLRKAGRPDHLACSFGSGAKEWMTGFQAGILLPDWTERCGRKKKKKKEVDRSRQQQFIPPQSPLTVPVLLKLRCDCSPEEGRPSFRGIFPPFLFFSFQPDHGEGRMESHVGLAGYLGCDSGLCGSSCERSGR